MAVKYTYDQFQAVKKIIQLSENFLDAIWKVMTDHELDKIEDFKIRMMIDPMYDLVTRQVILGEPNGGIGYLNVCKGKEGKNYATLGGENSPEYVYALISDEVKERVREMLQESENVPSDSIWLRGDSYDSDVDCGVSVGDMANG